MNAEMCGDTAYMREMASAKTFYIKIRNKERTSEI
jgi:hypothetical protein